jgi:hypothetical protein
MRDQPARRARLFMADVPFRTSPQGLVAQVQAKPSAPGIDALNPGADHEPTIPFVQVVR